PVHPLAETRALLGLHARVLQHALAAGAREPVEPIADDVALAVEPEVLLDLDLDPEPLAVEAILVALVVAEHRAEALEDVLVSPPPRVMDAHRVVRGDRPVHEAPRLASAVHLDALLERARRLPLLEDMALDRGKVRLRVDVAEHGVLAERGRRSEAREYSSE